MRLKVVIYYSRSSFIRVASRDDYTEPTWGTSSLQVSHGSQLLVPGQSPLLCIRISFQNNMNAIYVTGA
jgi:hypothetical protein